MELIPAVLKWTGIVSLLFAGCLSIKQGYYKKTPPLGIKKGDLEYI
jgi:hypothetical protein